MKIGFAQLNTTVGDLPGNRAKILAAYRDLVSRAAELVLTPGLPLTGYPPQDLVFKSRFVPANLEALDTLHSDIGDVPLLVGFIDKNAGTGQPFHNAAALLRRGEPARVFHKSLLPTYDVFDEDRYFEPAASVAPVDIGGVRFGVTICEDVWTEDYLPRRLYGTSPVASLIGQGATAILNLSASPFSLGKAERRAEMLEQVAARHRVPIFYCNAVGGNDELIFDGNSLAIDAGGNVRSKLAAFVEEFQISDFRFQIENAGVAPNLKSEILNLRFQPEAEELFHALSLGTRDYLRKCGFESAVLGLSGGIDSAVTAVIAAHALGPENVLGVTMPTQFSSEGSVADSLRAPALGIRACKSHPAASPPSRPVPRNLRRPPRTPPRKTCSRACAE